MLHDPVVVVEEAVQRAHVDLAALAAVDHDLVVVAGLQDHVLQEAGLKAGNLRIEHQII